MRDYYLNKSDGKNTVVEAFFDEKAVSPRLQFSDRNIFRIYRFGSVVGSPDSVPDRVDRPGYMLHGTGDLYGQFGIEYDQFKPEKCYNELREAYNDNDIWFRFIYRDDKTHDLYIGLKKKDDLDVESAYIQCEYSTLFDNGLKDPETIRAAADREVRLYNVWEQNKVACVREYDAGKYVKGYKDIYDLKGFCSKHYPNFKENMVLLGRYNNLEECYTKHAKELGIELMPQLTLAERIKVLPVQPEKIWEQNLTEKKSIERSEKMER